MSPIICEAPIQKSVFNRIIGDSELELLFARFLDDCGDVVSYAKIYFAVNFKLDYVNADGDISNYYPDFLVKLSDQGIFVVETKGQEDVDVPLKMERLRQWCEDINRVQSGVKYDFVYVDQESFERYQPTSFGSWLMASGNTKRKYNRALGRTVEIRPYEASARKGREVTTG